MRRMWLGSPVVLVLCASLVMGCGGSSGSSNDTAQEAAQSYVQARNQGDAGKVCELYSAQLIQRLHASNCEAFIREQTSGVPTSLTLVGVQQNGDRATATITSSIGGQVASAIARLHVSLERVGGEWKITALGGSTGD
jgi:hypothetical protein